MRQRFNNSAFHSLSFLGAVHAALLLLTIVNCAQSWQPVPSMLARIRSSVQIRQQQYFQGALGNTGVFPPSLSSPSRRHPTIGGSLLLLKGTNGDDSSNNEVSRRVRLRNRVSDIWSTIRLQSTDKHGHHQAAAAATTLAPPPSTEEMLDEVDTENKLLRETIRQLEIQNDRLSSQQRIVLESFEGENMFQPANGNNNSGNMNYEDGLMEFGITLSGEELAGDVSAFTTPSDEEAALWCDELEEDSCPVEPQISFGEALRDRAYWLVGLLIMQSCSGIILSRNEALLANHPVIIYFLTMLVGAGGNAGNQASVRVIRGIALGSLNERTQAQFLTREFKMAFSLSAILSVAGFLRAAAFRTPFPETVAITASLVIIVFTSVCLGAVLPLFLQKLRVDPAHSSTTIQVIMDILGVFVAVAASSFILDSPVGIMLIKGLGG